MKKELAIILSLVLCFTGIAFAGVVTAEEVDEIAESQFIVK